MSRLDASVLQTDNCMTINRPPARAAWVRRSPGNRQPTVTRRARNQSDPVVGAVNAL